nr:O-fucosyltransferase 29-like [Ipomoea batatas]
MGVAKAWRYSGGAFANVAVVQQRQKHFVVVATKKPISWMAVCGLILFVLGLISLFTGHLVSNLEWYSHKFIKRPWYSKLDRRTTASIDIWKSKYSNCYYGCSERSRDFASAVSEQSSNGYLLIATSGGLNQQRTGITDAVVVARILNATLVVPELDHHSFWKDDSDFLDIFDVNWFIQYLAKDVTIVKRVPEKVMTSMEKPPYTMRVPRKSEPDYYLDQVLPVLQRRRVSRQACFCN